MEIMNSVARAAGFQRREGPVCNSLDRQVEVNLQINRVKAPKGRHDHPGPSDLSIT